MTTIDKNNWKDNKKEVYLNPKLMERPLDEPDQYADFDDLKKPHPDIDGCRKGALWVVASAITLFFLIIMILYWIKWA